MSLAPGTHLGRYEIRSLLGAGGMGEVYLAHDRELDRQVAIKILPAELAGHQDRLQRFMQEARAASALNHPNILTVHEIGEAASSRFIVTEFIDGTTLRQRLAGKRLKIREVLDIAVQVADALSRAHQAGIVHRDVKPDNIMIRTDGIVKVLDFGLAKLAEPHAPSADASTRVAVNTRPGVVMGTSRYMSPEQARGLDLDARTDIFSLGIVLYQMAAGHVPFDGPTASDVMAAILDREPPPLAQAAPDLPHELDRIVSKALCKDREERYQVVKDLLLDLKALRRELDAEATAARPAAGFSRRTRLIGWLGASLAVAAVIVFSVFLSGGRATALTERDTIVLADFLNTTGDPVFDGTLKQGLAVQLGQSPYLNIFSDERVRDALRFMGRSPDDPVTRDVAREICQRQGLKALLAGSIAGLGSHYVLTLEAVNAQTGDTLAREQIEADTKEQVLRKLSDAATTLRERLGESLGSIQKFGTPIDAATTSSLEALKAFALGDEHRARGTYSESLPFYRRATELDPNFALAYARLAVMYFNLRQTDQAARNSEKAFELRHRVSERERFYIESRYYTDVLGDIEKNTDVLHLWQQTYPRDYVPHNNLAVLLGLTGQYEQVLAEAQESARLNPKTASSYTNIASGYLGLERAADAKAALEQALAQKLDSPTYHVILFQVAFVQDDAPAMRQQVDWAEGNPGGSGVVISQAATSGAKGRLREATASWARAADLTARTPEVAASVEAMRAVGDATFEECGGVRAATVRALNTRRTRNSISSSGLALAMCGDGADAQTLADELVKLFPSDTFVNNLWAPTIRAFNEIHRGNPAQAIQTLERVRRYEGGNAGRWVRYARGMAYLQQRAGAEASAEFGSLVEHKIAMLGNTAGGPVGYLYPLGLLGLARASVLSGDIAAGRKAYQDLFAWWKDADADFKLLRQAKDEYSKLK